MNAQQISEIKERIENCEDIETLARFIANEQYKYWYDPCGKSGHEFDEDLTIWSIKALRKIGRLTGLEK